MIKFNLNLAERKLFRQLSSPAKIQDLLNSIPANYELHGGETVFSPRMMLEKNLAHCMEGALFAAAVLWSHGRKPIILDLRTIRPDFDHVVALFQLDGYWGAISKSNHSVLQYRDPVYQTVRELVMSYFHEYFLSSNGQKTMRDYSKSFNLARFGTDWIIATEDLWEIDQALDDSPHVPILNSQMIKNLRRADWLEIRASDLLRFDRKGKSKK